MCVCRRICSRRKSSANKSEDIRFQWLVPQRGLSRDDYVPKQPQSRPDFHLNIDPEWGLAWNP